MMKKTTLAKIFLIFLSDCPECGKVFDEKHTMMRHYKSKHEGIKYPCDQCTSKFTDWPSLQKHVVISVIIKLHDRVIYRNISGLNMKVSNIIIDSVIIKLHKSLIFRHISRLNTKVLSIHVLLPDLTSSSLHHHFTITSLSFVDILGIRTVIITWR